MSDFLYTVRNYCPADFNNYVQFNIEVEKVEPTGYCVSAEVIAEKLHRPNYSPEQDLFIAETGGCIVGYLDITPELKIGRIILNCLVHPDHRRRGLASKIFGCALFRAKELGAKIAQVNIPQDSKVAKIVLSKLGFRFVRRFLQLRLDIDEVHWPDINQFTLDYRHLQSGEEDILTQLQNRSFAGNWGYNPNTVKEIVYRTHLNYCSPEDIILVSNGDKVVGYCWVLITHEATTDERRGQIRMLGVDPRYRRRGIGKRVLLAGLDHLKNKGLRIVELTVDSENNAACALYQSAGFKIWASSLWYEKVID